MDHNKIPLGDRVYLTQQDRSTHLHILGRSGMGKSRLIQLMLQTDIELNALQNGPGFTLIDPAGDLFDFAITKSSRYPQLRKRVHIIDPMERRFFPGLNYLDAAPNYSITGRVAMIIAAIQKGFGKDEERQVLLERMFSLILPVFLRVPTLTFAELPEFVGNDPTFRNAVLSKLKREGRIESGVLNEWRDFDRIKQPDKQKEKMDSVLNRVFRFAVGEEEQRIFCQPSTLNFRKIMDERGIILCRLPDAAGYPSDLLDLMGCFIVDCLIAAARSRSDQKEHKRVPHICYLDEFARFVGNKDIQRALDECRKFRLSFVLAHQHLAQLREKHPELYASVKTNCAVRICFSVSADDAKEMAEEMFSKELATDQVLDEIESQVITPVESTRVVKTIAQGTSFVESETNSESTSEAFSEQDFYGESESESESEVDSWSEADGESHMDAVSEVESETEGEGFSDSEAQSETFGTSEMDAETDMEAVSEMNSHSEMDGIADMTGSGTMASTGGASQVGGGVTITYTGYGGNGLMIIPDPITIARAENQSHTDGFQSGSSSSASSGTHHASGFSNATGKTHAHGVTHATGKSHSQGNTLGHTESKSYSKSHADGITHADGTSHMSGKGGSKGHAHGHSQNWGIGKGHTEGTSQGKGWGIAEGYSESSSESVVPFVEQHISREVSSRTFRSVQDKMYRIMHNIISLPHRHAFIQIQRQPPILFKTADTRETETTRTSIRRLRRYAYERNKSCRQKDEIDQLRLQREQQVCELIEGYRQEQFLLGTAEDATFEVLAPPQKNASAQRRRQNFSVTQKIKEEEGDENQ